MAAERGHISKNFKGSFHHIYKYPLFFCDINREITKLIKDDCKDFDIMSDKNIIIFNSKNIEIFDIKQFKIIKLY